MAARVYRLHAMRIEMRRELIVQPLILFSVEHLSPSVLRWVVIEPREHRMHPWVHVTAPLGFMVYVEKRLLELRGSTRVPRERLRFEQGRVVSYNALPPIHSTVRARIVERGHGVELRIYGEASAEPEAELYLVQRPLLADLFRTWEITGVEVEAGAILAQSTAGTTHYSKLYLIEAPLGARLVFRERLYRLRGATTEIEYELRHGEPRVSMLRRRR